VPHLEGPVLQPPVGAIQLPAAASAVPGTGNAAAPAPPPAALAAQLSRPVTALAGKTPGEHVLVLKVTPEDLGPVTVRALIGADSSVRVELFAPTDGGRDALKAVLAELKRDLAGSGLNASLDLSSRNQPGEQGAERRGPAQQHPGRSPAGRDDDAPQPDRRPRLSDDAPSLNVMA
jgi:flagellar hook-length control protein FliK